MTAYQTPAPRSFLDNAADCIEAGDEIGRRLYLFAHEAKIPFTAQDSRTVLDFSGPFAAKFPGVCALSGVRFEVGCLIRRTEIGMVMDSTMRAWDFTYNDGITASRWVAPTDTILAALAAGQMVATMNRAGIKRYWKQVGGKVEEVSGFGGRVMQAQTKSVAAFWSTVASKGQAVRVVA